MGCLLVNPELGHSCRWGGAGFLMWALVVPASRELSVLEWVSECTCILVPLHSLKRQAIQTQTF